MSTAADRHAPALRSASVDPACPADRKAVYGGYDRAGLEAQYNLRRGHPDRDIVYADFAARSAAMRRAEMGRYDLPYGPAERQRLDCFSAGEGGPVLVFFHGGYWRALDKSYFGFLAQAFVAGGWTVVLPNYTLAPRAGIDEIVSEARAAVRWAARSLLPEGMPLVVAGHSAGGHLALMCALDGAAPPHGTPVDAVVPVSGLFDLEPIRHTSINDLVRFDADAARRNSPVKRVVPSPVPLLLIVGGSETDEFRGQTERFADAWSAAGNRAETLVAEGLNHFSVLRALACRESDIYLRTLRFLERVRLRKSSNGGRFPS